jgi:hypothetical protein
MWRKEGGGWPIWFWRNSLTVSTYHAVANAIRERRQEREPENATKEGNMADLKRMKRLGIGGFHHPAARL